MDPLTGAAEDSSSVIDKTVDYKRSKQWDYAICITDLPIYKQAHFVMAEASMAYGVALISLPAFGPTATRRRLVEAILQLANEMHHGSSEAARFRQERQTERAEKVDASLRGKGARKLLAKRVYEHVFPIRRIAPSRRDGPIDVRFVADGRLNGVLRILSGMVRANRPWTIFPAFRRVIAAAFATGAYGLVFPNLWQMSDSYGGIRLVVVMNVAMLAMVAWIIIAHGLWESPGKARSPYLARLYNAVTVLTLSVGVIFYYIILLCLFIIAVLTLIPSEMLAGSLGHPVGLRHYVVLAWLASSVATVVGALGAGLEEEETVRNATYGYRQRRRNREARKRQE